MARDPVRSRCILDLFHCMGDVMTDERDRLLAEKARIEAELVKLNAELDWGPAVERFTSVYIGSNEPFTEAVRDALIAAAPLIPRDAGQSMTDAEIEALARDCADKSRRDQVAWPNPHDARKYAFEAAEAAIRETLKRAPVVQWPEDIELREMADAACFAAELMDDGERWNFQCGEHAALEMARRLKSYMTGEGK